MTYPEFVDALALVALLAMARVPANVSNGQVAATHVEALFRYMGLRLRVAKAAEEAEEKPPGSEYWAVEVPPKRRVRWYGTFSRGCKGLWILSIDAHCK